MPEPDRPTSAPAGGSRRAGRALAKRLLASRMVRYGFVVVVVGYGAYAVSKQWTDIHHAVGRIGLPMSLAALVFVLVALFASMLSWRALLAGLGSPLPVPVAALADYRDIAQPTLGRMIQYPSIPARMIGNLRRAVTNRDIR